MKKPKRWRPVPVAVQVKRHHKAVVAARKKAAAPAHVKIQGRAVAVQSKRSAAAKKAAKTRKWSPDEYVACCSARAVAEALRLASGVRLTDDDVLGLYWATATDRGEGQTILEALTVVQSLTGLPLRLTDLPLQTAELPAGDQVAAAEPDAAGPSPQFASREYLAACSALAVAPQFHGLILGLDLPRGDLHAVAVDSDGVWWSWGQPWSPSDFPGAVIEEAWAVTLA